MVDDALLDEAVRRAWPPEFLWLSCAMDDGSIADVVDSDFVRRVRAAYAELFPVESRSDVKPNPQGVTDGG